MTTQHNKTKNDFSSHMMKHSNHQSEPRVFPGALTETKQTTVLVPQMKTWQWSKW